MRTFVALRLCVAAAGLLALGPFAAAQEPRRAHTITIDDYFTQADIFQLALSLDSKHVAYTEGRWQQSTDDRKTDLWVVNTNTREPKRLTSDRASYRSPQWGADSRSVRVLLTAGPNCVARTTMPSAPIETTSCVSVHSTGLR